MDPDHPMVRDGFSSQEEPTPCGGQLPKAGEELENTVKGLHLILR